ncbi:MAG: hypothetical protein AAF809_08220 [Bacteroidota bacterium]
MGQQQLLPLTLSIVIVGLSVTSGIQAYTENTTKAALERSATEAIRMATAAIA